MEEWERPELLSMIICLDLEKTHGGHTIKQTIQYISCTTPPPGIPSLVVFFEFTGGRGTHEYKVVIDGPADFYQEAKDHITFGVPTLETWGMVRFIEPKFPVFGAYSVQLFVGGELMKQRVLHVQPKRSESA